MFCTHISCCELTCDVLTLISCFVIIFDVVNLHLMFLLRIHVLYLCFMLLPKLLCFNIVIMFLTSGRGSQLQPLLSGLSDDYVIALVTAFEEVTNAVTPTVDAVLRGGQLLKDSNLPLIDYNMADARIEHLQFRFFKWMQEEEKSVMERVKGVIDKGLWMMSVHAFIMFPLMVRQTHEIVELLWNVSCYQTVQSFLLHA